MIRISRFLKVEAKIVVARYAFEHEETKSAAKAVILLHPNFAKRAGVKEGDVVEVERKGRKLKMRVKLSENAPEGGGIIPNGIFASYLADFDSYKAFTATIELSEGSETTVEEILKGFGL